MPNKKVLAIVLAGGEGNRLMPLTADRAKPGVPFAGSYRLIDFALSNLVNSRYSLVFQGRLPLSGTVKLTTRRSRMGCRCSAGGPIPTSQTPFPIFR